MGYEGFDKGDPRRRLEVYSDRGFVPRQEVVGRWRELRLGGGMCEIRDRAIDAQDGGSIVCEQEACEGSLGRA
jgi:hypothetical protein